MNTYGYRYGYPPTKAHPGEAFLPTDGGRLTFGVHRITPYEAEGAPAWRPLPVTPLRRPDAWGFAGIRWHACYVCGNTFTLKDAIAGDGPAGNRHAGCRPKEWS